MVLIATLIALASICDAVCDTLRNNYSKSIFAVFNPQYWNPDVSYKNKWIDGVDGGHLKTWGYYLHMRWLNISFGIEQLSDAWHLFKTLWVCLLCLAATINLPIIYNLNYWLAHLIYFVCAGIIWNIFFSFCYDRLFKI